MGQIILTSYYEAMPRDIVTSPVLSIEGGQLAPRKQCLALFWSNCVRGSWAMGQMALPGHKWLLSNKQDFPRNMAREAPSFLYECGPCFKDLLAASKSYLSGGSLALASKCFRSWSESVVQNTTCYGDGYTCSMEKKLHFWPMSLQIEFKSLDDSNREMDSLLETQQSFFVILKQKYGVFCFTCWQPQPTVGL